MWDGFLRWRIWFLSVDYKVFREDGWIFGGFLGFSSFLEFFSEFSLFLIIFCFIFGIFVIVIKWSGRVKKLIDFFICFCYYFMREWGWELVEVFWVFVRVWECFDIVRSKRLVVIFYRVWVKWYILWVVFVR